MEHLRHYKINLTLAWAGMLVNGSTVTSGTLTNNHGLNILSSQAKQQSTYVGLGWKFGN